MNKQVYIVDAVNYEYYCMRVYFGIIRGFGYWSTNKDEAYNFKNHKRAIRELYFHDLSLNGKRKPTIVEY